MDTDLFNNYPDADKRDFLTALYGNQEVYIINGFILPDLGHRVEIVGIDDEPSRRSISIYELHYKSFDIAKEVFNRLFMCTPEQAVNLDKKRRDIKSKLKFLKDEWVQFN